jgi:hypothetical protein
MLVGGGLLFIGFFTGFIIGRRSRAAVKPAVLKCGCGHTRGSHKDGKRCQAQWTVHINYQDRWVQCSCHQYDGPVPISDLFTPPTMASEDVP